MSSLRHFPSYLPLKSRLADHIERALSLMWSFLLGLSLLVVCQSAMAQAVYRIKPLGNLDGCTSFAPTAYGFNEAGQVTGAACNANGDSHAFLWKNNGNPMVDLGPDELGSTSIGYDINASGLVAGDAQDSTGQFGFVSSGDGTPMTKILNVWGDTYIHASALNDSGQVTGSASMAGVYGPHAFLWKNDGSPMFDLGRLDYFYGEYGEVINDSGQVSGSSYDGDRGYYSFIWKNDGTPVIDLSGLGGGRTFPCCINASGQVAGSSSEHGYTHYHAFLWSNDGTRMLDLGTLARGQLSHAYALNDSGQVAGWSSTRFERNQHAFAWMNDGKPMKDLGTFGGTTSQSNAINASGQVTGWAQPTGDTGTHAFLWRNDGTKIQDLNTLVDSIDPLKSFVTLTSGEFINAFGDIVAYGTDSRTGPGLFLLQGTVLTLAPRSLAFGNQQTNTASTALAVTMTNTSLSAVPITSVSLAGSNSSQFTSVHNCGTSLRGGASCTISVAFKPTTIGSKTASLNVNGGGGGLRSVSLTGTGIAAIANSSITPTSLSFGNQANGSPSASKTVRVSNSGTIVLPISSIALSGAALGQFTQSTNCGAALAVGASCQINVVFTPTSTGTKTATLTVDAGAGAGSKAVALSGIGVATSFTLTPANLAFGSQPRNTSSAPKVVTITNTSTASLPIISHEISGTNASQFTQTTTCGASVAVGANCTISVSFKPTSVGSKTATLTVRAGGGAASRLVSLGGNGT